MASFGTGLVNKIIQWNEAKASAIISFNKARKNNPLIMVVCSVVEFVVDFFRMYFLIVTRNRVEPDYAFVSRFCYNPDSQEAEEVYPFEGPYTEKEMALNEYKYTVENYKDYSLCETTLITANLEPGITRIKLACHLDAEKDVVIPPSKSDYRFIHVEYHCGTKHGPILIDIPKSHYIVGNEILSMEYVLRTLEYLPRFTKWEFNENYKLNIIDADFKMIELFANQWVVLEDNSYIVEEVSAETLSLEKPLDEVDPVPEKEDLVLVAEAMASLGEDLTTEDLATEDLATEDLTTLGLIPLE
jgi:hypothetical protein